MSTDKSDAKRKVSRRNFIIGVGAGAVVAAVAVAGVESLVLVKPSPSTSTVTTTVGASTVTVTGPTTTKTSAVTSTATTTVTGPATTTTVTATPPAGTSSVVTLTVNGVVHSATVDNRWSLADTLRYKFNLIGTKVGCNMGECGACSVLVDGTPMLSCMLFAVEAQGHLITTVEGIGLPENLSPVQAALCDSDGIQCGACVPGIVVVASAFYKANPSATDAQWRAALSGNLCRCGNWSHILAGLEAVKS